MTVLVVAWLACAPSDGTEPTPSGGEPRADVVNVAASGDAGAYTLGVTLRSDETGCDQYADWWEVLTPEGGLVYRRILDHSHPDEQPFTRTGGPVAVDAATEVVVRGHLHREGHPGYDGALLRGSVGGAFSAWSPPEGWASDLADADPQPEACLF